MRTITHFRQIPEIEGTKKTVDDGDSGELKRG
jgi:hypothetical protein